MAPHVVFRGGLEIVRVLASTLTVTVWAVVGLSAGALIAAAAVLYIAWRRPSEARVEAGELRYMLDAVRRSEREKTELAHWLQLAEGKVARRAQLERIGHKLDLDSVLERSFEAARSVLEIDAGAISLLQPTGEPVVASFGLTEGGEEPLALQEPLPGTVALATTYHHAGASTTRAIRAGLTLRLSDEEDVPLGLLALYWRSARESLQTDDVELAEELARAIAGPLGNGLRLRNALRRANVDGLTGLRHNSAFREALAAEVARARRYRRQIGLLLLDIDDFKVINDQIGHLAGDTLLSEFGTRLANIARIADIPCRIGGDEFAVILPESGSSDALRLFERLQSSGLEHDAFISTPTTFSGGIAEWQFSEDAEPFFARADEALLEAKSVGKHRALVARSPGLHGSIGASEGLGGQN